MKPWLISAALLLATNCAATPVVLTSSSSGYVLFNGMQGTDSVLASINPGEDYRLTTLLSYDTDWIVSQGEYAQTVAAPVTMDVEFTLFGARRFIGAGTARTTVTPVDGQGNGGTLTLDIAFADPDQPRWSYRLVSRFSWLPGQVPGDSLLAQTQFSGTLVGGSNSLAVLENGEIVSGLGMPAGETGLTISAVPEPATYGMLLAGLAGVGLYTRRRKAA